MNKVSAFVDRYIYGIAGAIGLFVFVFVYLNLQTYTSYFPVGTFFGQNNMAQVEMIEELELTPENLQIDGGVSDVRSIGRNMNDTRERSAENWSSNKMSASQVEQSVKDYERQLFAETGGEAERAKIKQEMTNREKQQQQTSSSTPKESSSSTPGGNKAYSGNVMVEWNLRDPHQNNTWYVRNPGYTCGYGSSGKVTVRIKVNANGTVTNATYDANLSRNANSCMIEQAVKYAKLSRFMYASKENQDGTITYTFVSQ
ncbi:MAG: hypothetical protein V4638_04130 [Bacteroidota bacterium]